MGNATTDANGNFSFSYSTTNGADKLIIRESSGAGFTRLIGNVPLRKDVSDIRMFRGSGYYILKLELNVTNPYTSADTLYISKLSMGINYFKKGGPFTNGIIYTDMVRISPIDYEGNTQTIVCGRNSGVNPQFNKTFTVGNDKLCGDTMSVNLDIN